MKLTFDRGNLHALKVLISAYEVQQTLDLHQVARDQVPGLPCLEDGPVKLIHPNAACLYVQEVCSLVHPRLQPFLLLEATHIWPLIASLLSGKKPDGPGVQALAQQLRIHFQADGFIIKYDSREDVVSPADIIIWVDLYPLSHSPEVRTLLSAVGPNLWPWFDRLASRPAFVKAVADILGANNPKTAWQPWFKASVREPPLPPTPRHMVNSSAVTSSTSDVGSTSVISIMKDSELSEQAVADGMAAWNDWGCGKLPDERLEEHSTKAKKKVVLPVPGERNVLITSALPYANNVPHLGNIVGSVLSADVFARFCRLRGYNVLYICGTDEYGTTTETKAIEEGLTPKQISDKYHIIHSNIYAWFSISFDYFGRTTTPQQTRVAQSFFWDLYHEGHLIEDSMQQLYCKSCPRFLADRYVEGICPSKDCGFQDARGDQCDKCNRLINAVDLIQPRCKVCRSTPEVRDSKHIFINLPKIKPQLEKWFTGASGKWTRNAREIAKSWIQGSTELQPRCITRDLKWGTPVPLDGYQDKVFYVWFDAPIGYISITASYTEQWEQWWKDPDNVDYYEFMAKDNVAFHSVIFPSTQLGTGKAWTMVTHLVSTEYLNYEDEKFSKSRGIGVFGDQAQSTGIPADIWRFYLMYTRPESSDSSFKWEDLMLKNNSELLSNLGNFVNRALKFCWDNFSGLVPEVKLAQDKGDFILVALTNQLAQAYVDSLEQCKERDAISSIFSISRLGNQLMQAEKPWKLMKTGVPADRERAATVIGFCLNLACLLALLIEPYMPNMSKALCEQLRVQLEQVNLLRVSPQQRDVQFRFRCCLPAGHKIASPAPLVTEIKPEQIEALKSRFSGHQNP